MMVESHGDPTFLSGADASRSAREGAGAGRRGDAGSTPAPEATPFAALLLGLSAPTEEAARGEPGDGTTPAAPDEAAEVEGAARLLPDGVDDIAPELRRRLDRVIRRMEGLGHDVRVVEGFRTQARQESLWRQGRSAPGPRVTWTRNSLHTQGRAVDLQVNGGWSDLEAYRDLQRIAREEGLATLGMRDPGHLELPSRVASGEAVGEAEGFPGGRPEPVARPEVARRPRPEWAPEPGSSPSAARGPEQGSAAPRAGVATPARPAAVAQPAAVAPVARPARVPFPGGVVSGPSGETGSAREVDPTTAAAGPVGAASAGAQMMAGVPGAPADAPSRGRGEPPRPAPTFRSPESRPAPSARTVASAPTGARASTAASASGTPAADGPAPGTLPAAGAEALALGGAAELRVRDRAAAPASGAGERAPSSGTGGRGGSASGQGTSAGDQARDEASRTRASRVAEAVRGVRSASAEAGTGSAQARSAPGATVERDATGPRRGDAPATGASGGTAPSRASETTASEGGTSSRVRVADFPSPARGPGEPSLATGGSGAAGDGTRHPLPGGDAVMASSAPERAAEIQELQARARAAGGRLHLELSDLDGEGTNLRMRLRGSHLATTLEFQDADLTNRARTRVDELHRALERAGFDPESVVLRSTEPGTTEDRSGRGRGESHDSPFQSRDDRSRRDRRDDDPNRTPFQGFQNQTTEEER